MISEPFSRILLIKFLTKNKDEIRLKIANKESDSLIALACSYAAVNPTELREILTTLATLPRYKDISEEAKVFLSVF